MTRRSASYSLPTAVLPLAMAAQITLKGNGVKGKWGHKGKWGQKGNGVSPRFSKIVIPF